MDFKGLYIEKVGTEYIVSFEKQKLEQDDRPELKSGMIIQTRNRKYWLLIETRGVLEATYFNNFSLDFRNIQYDYDLDLCGFDIMKVYQPDVSDLKDLEKIKKLKPIWERPKI